MSASDISTTLVPSLEVDCFLCEPEPWRVIYSGRFVRIIVGLGALAEGYVLIAPISHIATTVELPDEVFVEFRAAEALLLQAFANQYSPQYTAYEHGRLGSCRTAEHSGAVHTFCFHAHRVFIPRRTSLSDFGSLFQLTRRIGSLEEFREWHEGPYVYYETGPPTERQMFSEPTLVPSQFMRRLIAASFGNDIWDWRSDLKLPTAILAIAALRGEFIGLDDQRTSFTRRASLQKSLILDGPGGAGKSSLADAISSITGAPAFNSGLVFRLLAQAELNRRHLSIDDLVEGVIAGDQIELRTPQYNKRTAEVAQIEANRALHDQVVERLLFLHSPCILTGRDSWRHARLGDVCLRLDASFETRARRLFLQLSKRGVSTALDDVRAALSQSDRKDESKLPSAEQAQVVTNDRRPFGAVLREVLTAVGVQ